MTVNIVKALLVVITPALVLCFYRLYAVFTPKPHARPKSLSHTRSLAVFLGSGHFLCSRPSPTVTSPIQQEDILPKPYSFCHLSTLPVILQEDTSSAKAII